MDGWLALMVFATVVSGAAILWWAAVLHWIVWKNWRHGIQTVDYTPTDVIVITPNEFGPYCSVFTNQDKSRIGIRLERFAGGKKPVVWLDSKVTPRLADALLAIEGTSLREKKYREMWNSGRWSRK
jgi:hypothetical protein